MCVDTRRQWIGPDHVLEHGLVAHLAHPRVPPEDDINVDAELLEIETCTAVRAVLGPPPSPLGDDWVRYMTQGPAVPSPLWSVRGRWTPTPRIERQERH